MVRTNHVKVNKEAIKEKVYNMNSSLADMSRTIGRGDSWLPQLVRSGSSGVTHIRNIQKLADALGCTIDDLVEQYDDATQREYDEFDSKDDNISNVKERVFNLMGVPVRIPYENDKEYHKARREAGAKLDMTVWDLLSGYDAILEQIAVMINGDETIYYKELIPEDILDSYVENWKVLRKFNVLGVSVEVPLGYLLLKITLKEDE